MDRSEGRNEVGRGEESIESRKDWHATVETVLKKYCLQSDSTIYCNQLGLSS